MSENAANIEELMTMQKNIALNFARAAKQNSHKQSVVAEKKPRNTKLILGIIGVVLVLVLAIWLYPREVTIIIDFPIPYVFNEDYEQVLSSYGSLEGHSEALVIYGAPRIGKSRGIQTFVDNDLQERLVLNFDFSQLSTLATDSDIFCFLQAALQNGFRRIDSHSYRSAAILKNELSNLETIAAIDQMNYTDLIYKPIRDPYLFRAYKSFASVLPKVKENTNIGVQLFFSCLEYVGESLRPIIIIKSPEVLDSIQTNFSKQLFSSFLMCINQITKDTLVTGVIIEVSDSVWLANHFIDNTPLHNVFRLFKVNEFDLNAAKRLLSGKGMFKHNQISQIFDEFGGNGQYFATIHELMREDHQYKDAFNVELNSVSSQFKTALFNQNEVKWLAERENLLSRLLINDIEANFTDISIRSLINHRILTATNATHITFANRAMLLCAERYLNEKNSS